MARIDARPYATLHWRHPELADFRKTSGYLPLFTCKAVPSVSPDIATRDAPGTKPLDIRRSIGTVGFFVTTAMAMLGYRPAEGDKVLVFATQPANPDAVGEADGPLPLDASLALENGRPRSKDYYLHIIVKTRDGVGGRFAPNAVEGIADDCHLEPSSRGEEIFDAVIEGTRAPAGTPCSRLHTHRVGLRLERRLHQSFEQGHLGFFVVPNYTSAPDGSPLQEVDIEADFKLRQVCARLLPVTVWDVSVPPVSRPLPDEAAVVEVPLHIFNYAWASFWAGRFGTADYLAFCEHFVPAEVAKADKRGRDSVTVGSAFSDVGPVFDDRTDEEPTYGDGGGGKRPRRGQRGGSRRGDGGSGGRRGRRARKAAGAISSIGELVASNEDAPFRYDAPSLVESWSLGVAAETKRTV